MMYISELCVQLGWKHGLLHCSYRPAIGGATGLPEAGIMPGCTQLSLHRDTETSSYHQVQKKKLEENTSKKTLLYMSLQL